MTAYPVVCVWRVQARYLFQVPAAAALAVVVAACAVSPSGGPAPAARAKRLEAAGQYRKAGDAWLVAAGQAQKSGRAEDRLNAALDYEKADAPGPAWEAVAPVAIRALPAERRLAGAEAKARIALATHRPRAALAALGAAPAPPAASDRARLLELEGRARFADEEPAAGLEALVARGRLLTGRSDVLANDELLWSQLLDASELPSAAGLSTTAQGWIALAQIWRGAWEVPGKFGRRLDAWRSAYPGHPAGRGLIAEIVAEEHARLSYPQHIALLLPMSGPYASQAKALESGILAAYYRGSRSLPDVTVYDTQGTGSGARSAVAKAQAAGADFMLGPVTKAGVGGAASAAPDVPVLALNYLPSNQSSPKRFFQFGLSPDEEATMSAERAVSKGLSRAVVLAPSSDWGGGIADAFTRRLTHLGGRVLASATFRDRSQQFGAPLSKVFGLNASTRREQRLASVLGQPLGFEPRRRRDVQFVFFAAPFDTARLLVPQIDYYQGIGLPVYSISDVYQPGGSHPDLNGVHFPVMPWFVAQSGPIAEVRGQVKQLFPQVWNDFAPLYALGYDAWRLVPLLGNAGTPLPRPVRGVTGMLSLGPGNVVRRSADWGRYDNGRLRPEGTPGSP